MWHSCVWLYTISKFHTHYGDDTLPRSLYYYILETVEARTSLWYLRFAAVDVKIRSLGFFSILFSRYMSVIWRKMAALMFYIEDWGIRLFSSVSSVYQTAQNLISKHHNLDDSTFFIADFATLLTGRTSSTFRKDDGSPSVGLQQNNNNNNNNNYVATGRFTLHRKNLYYSFYVSDPFYRPRALQFADFEGNILWEQALLIEGVTSVYQNATGKVMTYVSNL